MDILDMEMLGLRDLEVLVADKKTVSRSAGPRGEGRRGGWDTWDI